MYIYMGCLACLVEGPMSSTRTQRNKVTVKFGGEDINMALSLGSDALSDVCAKMLVLKKRVKTRVVEISVFINKPRYC